jgi:hypothetical protein
VLDYFMSVAVHRSREHLVRELSELEFVPYARVRRQLLRVLKEVNRRRGAAGFEPVPTSCLRLRRYPTRVFEGSGGGVEPEPAACVVSV